MPPTPRIARTTRTVLSPWVTLVERAVAVPGLFGAELPVFHSLAQADYVTILAETATGETLLVEQFRPALERVTLELPGGILDPGEDPARCAARELAEETGYAIGEEPRLLGRLAADTGRLENHLWCFHGRAARPIPGWQPEAGVTPCLVTRAELEAMVADGRFDHALHIAVIGLALLKGGA